MGRRDAAPPEEPLGGQSVTDVTPPVDEPAPTVEPEAEDRKPTAEDRTSKVPPYYIATQPLFLGDQFSRAHNVGDHVPAAHVEAYGWADKVRRPDDTPEQPSAAPRTEPETPPGQAISKESGDA
ncbi:hypothetical protein [Streptosporangium canum]|uniref:hypothetical protein n=1 Tax=Streptosporangium canum TaxID=324952 RepID=UPI0033AE5457